MEYLIPILGSGGFAALVSEIFHLLRQRREKDEDIMLLLYHDIKQECKEYIALGYVDSEGLEVLLKMHQRYHSRGGNGYLDRLMDAVRHLPIKD